jgi:hypothetical protein
MNKSNDNIGDISWKFCTCKTFNDAVTYFYKYDNAIGGYVPMISINNCIYSLKTNVDKIKFIEFINTMYPFINIEYSIDTKGHFRFKYPHNKQNPTTIVRYNYEKIKEKCPIVF